MAPALLKTMSHESFVTKRESDIYCDYNGYCYENSNWNTWGRWVALVIVIAGFVLLAFLFSLIQSRRRRRAGARPIYGTGWMAPPPAYGQHNQYPQAPYGQQQQSYGPPPPPPVYGPPIGGQKTGNTNDGYFGGAQQQHGFELQQPSSAYQPVRQADTNVYEPPVGPPPKH